METAGIFEKLTGAFTDQITETITENPDPYVIIRSEALSAIATYARNEADLNFDFLESVSGVDLGDRLQIVYHLLSYEHGHSLVLKTDLPYDNPTVPSVACIWAAAEWHEREQYDLFGIHFEGHRDLRRLLLPEDWVGHPLLKSYKYPDSYHGIDHYRPDPKDQLKALDDLVLKAKEAARAQEAGKKEADGKRDAKEASPEAEKQPADKPKPAPAAERQAADKPKPAPAAEKQPADKPKPAPADEKQAADKPKPAPADEKQPADKPKPTPADEKQAAEKQAADKPKPAPAEGIKVVDESDSTP